MESKVNAADLAAEVQRLRGLVKEAFAEGFAAAHEVYCYCGHESHTHDALNLAWNDADSMWRSKYKTDEV